MWVRFEGMRTLPYLLLFIASFHAYTQSSDQKAWTIIHGDKHVFKVETPHDWVRDTESAQKSGLVAFFYPKEFVTWNKVYAFAHGYDKTEGETLKTFKENNISRMRKRYPEMEVNENKAVGNPPILRSTMLTFTNLTDRYKEEAVYLETETSFVVLVYAASTKDYFDKYVNGFDEFIQNFKYLGTNIEEFRKK